MAHREHVAYIGSFHDSSYGIDDEGELFRTIADAKAALHARHRADDWEALPVLRPNGRTEHIDFQSVSNEAHILIWQLRKYDQLTPGGLIQRTLDANGALDIRTADYFPAEADLVVWVGARQAIRSGTLAEFNEQRTLRNRQDVREAGSVVVTDA